MDKITGKEQINYQTGKGNIFVSQISHSEITYIFFAML